MLNFFFPVKNEDESKQRMPLQCDLAFCERNMHLVLVNVGVTQRPDVIVNKNAQLETKYSNFI